METANPEEFANPTHDGPINYAPNKPSENPQSMNTP